MIMKRQSTLMSMEKEMTTEKGEKQEENIVTEVSVTDEEDPDEDLKGTVTEPGYSEAEIRRLSKPADTGKYTHMLTLIDILNSQVTWLEMETRVRVAV